jgi:hypothetical protein
VLAGTVRRQADGHETYLGSAMRNSIASYRGVPSANPHFAMMFMLQYGIEALWHLPPAVPRSSVQM